MQMKEIKLTPELATKWLEGNVHNRTLRQSRVEQYARDMTAGKWLLTHEPIAFDDKGVMVDGQHRCWAVVESGVAIMVMVAYGVSMESQAVIDTGLPRTMVDVMHLVYGKTEVNSMHVAIAKMLAAGGNDNRGGKGALTHQEMVEILAKHDEAITFAVNAFPRRIRFVTVAPVMTVIARAYYHTQRTLLTRFADLLMNGKGHRREEEAAILLRNWLLEKAPLRSSAVSVSHRTLIYGKTERAVASFIIGEQLNTLYAAHNELFPLPSEQKAAKAMTAAKKAKETDYAVRLKVKLRKATDKTANGSGARA